MRSTTISWAMALAALPMHGHLTLAEAAPAQERPRYYFPRQVKRQTANNLSGIFGGSDNNNNDDGNDGNGGNSGLAGIFDSGSENQNAAPSTPNWFAPTSQNATATTSSFSPEQFFSSLFAGPTAGSSILATSSDSSDPGFLQPSSTTQGVTASAFNPSSQSESLAAPSSGLGSAPLSSSKRATFEPSSTLAPTTTETVLSSPVPDSQSGSVDLNNSTAVSSNTGNTTDSYTFLGTSSSYTSPSSTSSGGIVVGLSTIISNTDVSTSTQSPLLGVTLPTLLPTAASTSIASIPSGNATISALSTKYTYVGTGTAPTASATSDGSDLISSIVSEIASATSSAALSSIASSLSSELSSIVASATNSVVVSSISSGLSSALSEAVSSMVASGSTNSSVIPTASATAGMSTTSATWTPSYTLSLSTGPTGTTAVPVSVGTSTGSITPSNGTITTSSAVVASTIPTSIPLTSNATAVLTSSGVPTSSTVLPTSGSVSSAVNTTTALSSSSLAVTSTPLASSSIHSNETTAVIHPSTSSAEPASTTSVASSQTSSSVSSVTSIPTTTTAPHSMASTGTNTATSMSVPTSIVYASSTSASLSTGQSSTTGASQTSSAASGIPTYLPRLIQAPGGLPSAPSNFTLIQLGFDYALNYPFVVSQEDATSQIFAFLPQGVAFGLSLSDSEVVMSSLMPYDTSKSLGYITTLAQAYIPNDMVTSLQQGLHAPNGLLYSNPNAPVHTIMSMINPTIPLLPGSTVDAGAEASAPENPEASSSSPAGDGAPIGGDSGSSQPVKGSTVGIGLGAVAGAAVYAAAMVYVARRYRQKRTQRHQRNPSAPTAERGMSQISGGGMGSLFMSGANGHHSGSGVGGSPGSRNSGHSSNGRSVRDQGISNPITSENSLGWN